jgi:hypothetical protein
VLSSLSTTSGGAGQVVTVSGSNFMSANGDVQAHFGSQEAPTACPNASSCTVTVPTLSGSSRSVPLTITTQSGTSNAVNFDYS